MEFLKENLTVILAAIAGVIATGFVVKVVVNKKTQTCKGNNTVKQQGNTVGGDMAGRDLTKTQN